MAVKIKFGINLAFVLAFLVLGFVLIGKGHAVSGGTLITITGIWSTAWYILAAPKNGVEAPK